MLVEREHELDMVAGAVRRATAGAGSQVVITGPLGIGKTALLQALPPVTMATGVRVLRANAAFLERDFAFGVARQILEPALSTASPDERDRWLAGAATLARTAFADDSLTGEYRPIMVHQPVLHGMYSLVANMAFDQPLLILVDDLHQSDIPSLRWLAYLGKRLHRLPITVVMTMREGDSMSDRPLVREIISSGTRIIHPEPLSLAGTQAMVSHHFGESGDEEFTLACHETSGGIPIFLASILLSLEASERRPVKAEAENVRMMRPAHLCHRVTSCLRAQPKPIRQFANAIAVLGDQADPELIGMLAGLDSVGRAESIRTMQQLGLLTPGPSHRFVHLIVQDAIEAMMTLEERERLHLRAAVLLHGTGHSAEQVAAHLLAVTSHQDRWAIEVLRCAADTAYRRLAPDVAARYLRRALLDCSLDGEDRAELLVDLAAAERCFDPAASLRHISQAVPLLKTVSKRAAAVVRIAPTILGSSPASLLELIRQVADELGPACALLPAERELSLRLEARLRYCGQDDPLSLGECVDRLHALGPEPPLDTAADRELLMVLLRGASVTGQVSADRVAQLGNAILQREPASQPHMHTALPALIITLVSCDSIATVSGWLEIALDQARRCEDTAGQAAACAEQALVLMAMGRLPEARERVGELFELGEPEWDLANMTSRIALALFAVETRDTVLSDRLLQQGHGRIEGLCASAQRHLLWASGAASRGEPALALEHVMECGGQLERAGWRNAVLYPWRPWAASLHYKLGNIDQAHDLIAEEYTRAMAWGAPVAIGRALRVRGRLAGRGQDIALLREAVEVLSDSANQLELAKAVVLLGRRMRAAGLPDAEDYLRRGYQLAGTCGAPWLSDHPIAQPRRPADLSNLTKTERKVAGLAVRGQTNQEIADSFGVSCRAVEKHLTNVYRKLGVPGRAGLVAAEREAAQREADAGAAR